MGRETSAALKELFERVEALPDDVQAEALRLFEEVEADLTSPLDLGPEDLAAIEEGLEDVRQGRVVSMDEVRALFDQYRTK